MAGQIVSPSVGAFDRSSMHRIQSRPCTFAESRQCYKWVCKDHFARSCLLQLKMVKINTSLVNEARNIHRTALQGTNKPSPVTTFDEAGFPGYVMNEVKAQGFAAPESRKLSNQGCPNGHKTYMKVLLSTRLAHSPAESGHAYDSIHRLPSTRLSPSRRLGRMEVEECRRYPLTTNIFARRSWQQPESPSPGGWCYRFYRRISSRPRRLVLTARWHIGVCAMFLHPRVNSRLDGFLLSKVLA